MKKIKYIFLSVLIIFVLGIFLPKWFLQDISNVLEQDSSYAKNITRQLLDNPIEKVFIVKIIVTGANNGVFITESYIWGGILYATVKVFDKGADVTRRRLF